MEGFNEQVVKRDKTAKSLFIKIAAVVLLFAVPLSFVLLGRIIPYMAMVGLFIFIGGIYVVWWVFTSQKVEYEYAVNGDVLDVAKIVSLRKRKRLCRRASKRRDRTCVCRDSSKTRLSLGRAIEPVFGRTACDLQSEDSGCRHC